jgi:hypothetical protein
MSDDAAPIQMSELDRDAMVLQDLFYSIKARRCLWPGVYDLHMSPANIANFSSILLLVSRPLLYHTHTTPTMVWTEGETPNLQNFSGVG